MSDLFLLPCVVSPTPLAPRPVPGLRTHTAPFTLGLPPAPLPFSLLCSVFTCNLSLNVQCLFCSGVLRPSQWIGSSFGAEVTAPPTPLLHHSPFLPLLLFFPQGRQTAWEMGPTCAAWWLAAPLPLHVSRLPGGGQGWAPPPHPASGMCWGGGGEGKPSHPPASRSTSPSGCGRGRAPPPQPPGQSCCAAQPPPPIRCTQTPTRAQTFVLLIW